MIPVLIILLFYFSGERPYVCDICHKGFKQSSDLKKHRRTHTLDKPYKCPICPSAFTRSHHCRGHINSVHKFFKCIACSALFTSEEAFERHKEFHPSVFPDQTDGEQTPSELSDSAQKGNAQKDSTEEDHDVHEKNLKLDVANQLLELHKIMQQRSSPSNTTGSGSETASDSGDEASLKQSPPPVNLVKPARPQPPAAVSPGLTYQEVSNRLLPNMSLMEQVRAIPPKMTNEGAEFHVPQSAQMRYSRSPQPNPQGMDYLRLPYQSTNHAENRSSSPERTGHVSVSLPERQKSPMGQSINAFHSAVNSVPQLMPHFAANFDHQMQRRLYSNFIENISRAENSPKSSVEVSKTAESQDAVPCHRVSVIQYHSSQKPSDNERNDESLIKGSLAETNLKSRSPASSKSAAKSLENIPGADQMQNHQLPQNYSLIVNNMKYLHVGIPHDRIPYVPHNAESPMTLQSWSKEIKEHAEKYSWAFKEAKKTCEQLNTRDQTMQFSPAKSPLENDRRNIFSQANTEPPTSLYNIPTSQERSADMLKYFAREQNKLKDEDREERDDDSETSEASESGDVPSDGKMAGNAGQQSPSSESLTGNNMSKLNLQSLSLRRSPFYLLCKSPFSPGPHNVICTHTPHGCH